MVKEYIPKQGDILYVDNHHEQLASPTCVVISNNIFNKNTKMVIVCPITTNDKFFPTHYLLKNTKKIHGSVLCEHIRSIDYEIRKIKYIEKCSDEDLISIIMLMNACIEE